VDILKIVLPGLMTAVLAGRADAHIVPIPPSLCAFGTIDLAVPAARLTTSAAVPTAGTRLRIVYDANASVVHACPAEAGAGDDCGDSVPYGFELDASSGSLVLPAQFGGLMESSGDMVLDDLPVAVTLGGVTADVPVTLTTGLAAAGDTVAEGAPLQGLGAWTLVGVLSGDALPPPLTGQALLLSVACQPRPVPDKDQFVPPSVVGSLRGQVGPETIRLQARVTVGPADRPALSRGPVVVAVHVDGTTIATAVVASGLHGTRRRQAGTSDDGRTTVTARGRSTKRLNLTIEMHGAPPLTATSARALVGVTIDTGSLLARGERLFRAAPDGRALRR
jgi:hypothetical protein